MAFENDGSSSGSSQPAPGSTNDKRRALRRRSPSGTPGPTQTATGNYQPDTGGYGRIGLIDQQSVRLLPTEVVLDIAGLDLDDKDRVRISRMLARNYDVDPRYVFGVSNPREYLSKQTGEPVSLRDMHRITDGYAPAAIAAMLEDAQVAPGRKERGADANAIGRMANILSREYGSLDLASGIALAQRLVSDGVTPAKFLKNYQLAREWGAANGVTDEDTVFQAALAVTNSGPEVLVPENVTELRQNQQAAIEMGVTTQEQIDRLSQDNAAIARATGDIDLLAFNQDYWAQIQSASARVQLNQLAFERSLLGKTLGVAGVVLSKAWEETQLALIELGTDIVTPVAVGLTALGLDPQGDSIDENLRLLSANEEYAKARIRMGDTVGDLVEEGGRAAGATWLPDWTSTAFDFGVGWYVDPFVIAGKVGRVARGIDPLYGGSRLVVPGRTLPRIDESLKLTERIFIKSGATKLEARIPGLGHIALQRKNAINDALNAGFQKYVTQSLPKSRVADKLFDALYKSNHAYLRELDLRTPGRIIGRALDYEYMKFVRSKMLEQFPKASSEARQAFGDALTAHFVGFGPEGSVAELAVAARIDRAKKAVVEGAARGDVPVNELAIAASEHLALGGENAFHIPFSVEGPARSGLYGPRRIVRRGVYSQVSTETALGKRLAGLPNINPGRVLNPHDLPDEYMLLHARRWGTFDERQVRAFQSQALEITARGGSYRTLPNGKTEFVGMETALARLVDDINDQAFEAIIKPYNLDKTARDTLYDNIFGETKRQNYQTQTFMVKPGKKADDIIPIEVPVLETQLRNSIFVVDPVHVRSIVKEYTGWGRRAHAQLAKALRKDAPEIAAHIDRNVASQFLQSRVGNLQDIARFYQRFWKGATVARPGYIPRVILGDENARFMVTTRSFTERILAQEWFGLTGKLDNTGLFDEVFSLGDDTVRIGLPGAYERNPLAQGTIRESEIITEMMRDAGKMFDNLTPTGSWKPLRASEGVSQHLKAWEWALSKQFSKSRPGQVALETIAAGGDVSAVRKALKDWANEDKFVTLRTRIGVEPAEFESWFNDVSLGAWAYTMGRRDIADAALAANSRDLRALLSGTKIDARPVVHGPGMEALLQGDTFTKGFVNKMYSTWVRKPENALNRQPFYKTWKRRAEVAYTDLLARSGAEMTPQLRQAIDTASTGMALEQVRKVMFDLTRQSRFTELLQYFFPFPQPFFEGFQTWGAIALRNPEGVGRIMQLFRTGVDTGFIKKDEQTGEYVVSMEVFRQAAPALWALGVDEAGRVDKVLSTFVAPLSSFNMLASTTIKFGPEGFVGKMVGGVPIPVPGLNPPIALFLQNMFADTNSIPLTSYLFQYGPGTTSTLVPTQIKVALSRVMPEQFPDKQAETLAYSILRAYQVEGLDRDENGKKIPLEELERMALEDAKELAFTRAVLSLLSPASLRAKTTASPYEAEWQELVSSSESYFDAIDEWNKLHPTLSYVPVGKTFYDAGFVNEATGATADAPRLPTSALVGELLSTPGIGDFMKANPQWAGLLLLGLDPALVEAQDFPTYSRLLSNGMLKYKPISRFLEEGESQNGKVWNQIDLFYRDFEPAKQAFLAHADDEDTAYINRFTLPERDFLTDIATRFPDWAKYHLEYHEDGDYYDWPGFGGGGKPAELILADARRILDTPGMQNVPGFQALQAYVDVHDEYAEKMNRKGFTDIMQPTAQEDGITAAYARDVKAIIEGTPGIDQWLGAYFGVRFDEEGNLYATSDLRGLTPDRQLFIDSLNPKMAQRVDEMDVEYRKIRRSAQTDFNFSWEVSERYNASARYFDQKWFKERKVAQNWWKSLGVRGREEYKAGLATKPAVFFSAFDWHLVDVDVTQKQARWLSQIGDARVKIAQLEEEDPEYSESSGYEILNKAIRGLVAEDPKFGDLIDRMNRSSFPLRSAGYAKIPGKTGFLWGQLLDAVDAAQEAFYRGGFTGTSDYDTDKAKVYDTVQDVIIDWVERKGKKYPAFARSWDELTKEVQGPIIGDLLLPDAYYPLGRVEDD